MLYGILRFAASCVFKVSSKCFSGQGHSRFPRSAGGSELQWVLLVLADVGGVLRVSLVERAFQSNQINGGCAREFAYVKCSINGRAQTRQAWQFFH